MKKGFVYTLVFMIVLSAVFTFALAAAFEAFKPSIAGHRELAEQRAVLYAFGLEEGLDDDQVRARFESDIQPGTFQGEGGYTLVQAGETKGYAMPFEGAGLWGTIRGYLGVDAQREKATGLVFTAQNETPGLGGRIDEDWFKQQFREVPLVQGTPISYGDGIDAVTGATQTSNAVLKIVNEVLNDDFYQAEVQ